MTRTKIAAILHNPTLNQQILVKAWVRTKRGNKNVNFIALNDGSTIENIQVVAESSLFSDESLKDVTTGACIAVKGTLKASQGAGQSVELEAESIEILGKADPETYPLQPKKHSLEFLREIAHLRPRSSTFSAVFRIRHQLSYAVHTFFHQKGFSYIHTPIITASDAEGAGEMFQVTTLDLNKIPKDEAGKIDFKNDFFGRQANLTVSGQLEGELFAMALGEIYTFGPTFRAENSNTARHLAEFWMIEPEMAFYELPENMALAEEFLKYLISYILENCKADLDFLAKRFEEEEKNKKQEERAEMGLLEKLEFVRSNDFVKLTYTEAIEILKDSKPNKKGQFKYPIEKWGSDLQSEHERFLVEKHFKKPVILYNYPKEIKAFYMKQNPDNTTVAAMDVLFPGIGEIIGGSQREENLEKLSHRIKEVGIEEHALWWYLDTRKFGACPHSGFGLGFERLMLFITGMSNIRDVIPFPRTPQNADF